MKRILGIARDISINLRGWRAKRRLHSEAVTELVETVRDFQKRVDALEADLDELRADSRRVAELRIQVEDFLADHG